LNRCAKELGVGRGSGRPLVVVGGGALVVGGDHEDGGELVVVDGDFGDVGFDEGFALAGGAVGDDVGESSS